MNCFEWNLHTSDALDGCLGEEVQAPFDKHLKECQPCKDRLAHFQKILATLSEQPRSNISPHLKAFSHSNPFPMRSVSMFKLPFRLPRWKTVPWYLRTLIEAAGIVTLILLGISSAPRLRTLYENSFEKKLNDFRESAQLTEPTAETLDPSLAHNPLAINAQSAATASDSDPYSDELSGEDDSTSEEDEINVGRSQLWRFTIKTVSPDELRPLVVKSLTEIGVSTKTPGIRGIQVPGGIEFDLVLPQHLVPQVKQTLQKLTAPSTSQVPSHSPAHSMEEMFTWYRVKSRRKLPDGKSQVVIWLSQPTI